MPELPEVETIRRQLQDGGEDFPSLLGMRIADSTVYWERSLAMPGVAEFRSRLQGQAVNEVRRRGKFLLFKLDDDTLLIHLRMSGDCIVEPIDADIAPHHRIVIDFHEPWRLAFNDLRKFGRVWLVREPEMITGRLGPEPLDPDFTADAFWMMLHERRRLLKPLLLDQGFLAGLGNIYTDESLHLARLHPLRVAAELTRDEANHLWSAVRSVLEEGIRRNGASIDWVYRGGDFQNYFRVYGRSDQPCPECGTAVRRMVVGQRSTFYCPFCQVVLPKLKI